jgi:hypothetical protein
MHSFQHPAWLKRSPLESHHVRFCRERNTIEFEPSSNRILLEFNPLKLNGNYMYQPL